MRRPRGNPATPDQVTPTPRLHGGDQAPGTHLERILKRSRSQGRPVSVPRRCRTGGPRIQRWTRQHRLLLPAGQAGGVAVSSASRLSWLSHFPAHWPAGREGDGGHSPTPASTRPVSFRQEQVLGPRHTRGLCPGGGGKKMEEGMWGGDPSTLGPPVSAP